MHNFTPYSAFFGGVLIGISAVLLLWLNGRVSGISGIMHGMMGADRNELFWRVAFLLGLVIGGFLFHWLDPNSFVPRQGYHWPLLVVGGFLVGFGARMGNGCTSGHAVCGLGNFSIRSLVATLIFMTTGMITVYVLRHVVGN